MSACVAELVAGNLPQRIPGFDDVGAPLGLGGLGLDLDHNGLRWRFSDNWRSGFGGWRFGFRSGGRDYGLGRRGRFCRRRFGGRGLCPICHDHLEGVSGGLLKVDRDGRVVPAGLENPEVENGCNNTSYCDQYGYSCIPAHGPMHP